MKWRVPEILLGGLLVVALVTIGWSLRALGVGSDVIVLPALAQLDADHQIAFWTMVLALFTLALGGATILLFVVTRQTVQHATSTSVRDLRAYVMFDGFAHFVGVQGEQYDWQLRPRWKNTGKTPTRQLRLAAFGVLLDAPLPDDFEPAADLFGVTGTGLVGPNSDAMGGLLPAVRITADQMLAIIEGRLFLYAFGWVRYRDVFENTPERVTRFAHQIMPGGDPEFFDAERGFEAAKVTFGWVHLARHNSMDED